METRFHSRIEDLDAAGWDRLQDSDYPFTRWDFLAALERNYCVASDYGWQPHHIVCEDDGRLLAASPFYIKNNSHGEFVFDWAWVDAYSQHGLNYFPKTLCAIPYTPVPGPRLLSGTNKEDLLPLIQAQIAETGRLGASSCHWLFADDDLAEIAGSEQLLERNDIQFHWKNRGYRDFQDFLSGMHRRARKNIRQERKRIHKEGFEFVWRTGEELSSEELKAAFDFYALTFARKGNLAVLNRSFFGDVAAAFGDRFLVCLARRHERFVAGAIFLRDDATLYGRYWGSERHYPFLHFETCYYQGIELCIREGLQCFQPGAQGEFKMRRGFETVTTRSWHWIADPRFRDAIQRYLLEERRLIEEYCNDLQRHSPYR